ncbi:RHO1 GDP-GTP exchange protein 1/2, partial [Tremellales sp. Uapishka_1]
MTKPKPPRHVAVAIIYNPSTRRLLMVTSRKHPHLWIVPKGGIEDGETSGQAAVREAWEEAGTPQALTPPSEEACLLVLDLPPGPTQKRGSVWHVQLLQTSQEEAVADWLESDQRKREWVTLQECSRRINEWYTDEGASKELEGDAEEIVRQNKAAKKGAKGGAMKLALKAFMDVEGLSLEVPGPVRNKLNLPALDSPPPFVTGTTVLFPPFALPIHNKSLGNRCWYEGLTETDKATPSQLRPSSMSSLYLHPSRSRQALPQPPSPTPSASSSSFKVKNLRKLRPWPLGVPGRRKTGWENGDASSSPGDEIEKEADRTPTIQVERLSLDGSHGDSNEYEWEGESEGEYPDGYSWVDPSIIGTERLGATPDLSSHSIADAEHEPTEPALSGSRNLREPSPPTLPPEAPTSPVGTLSPAESYNLLLAYQAMSTNGHSPPSSSPHTPTAASDEMLLRNPDPEWYEVVDNSVLTSLGRTEVKRQGLWWELIRGEREYVRDLQVLLDAFIQPLREADPPLLLPEPRLKAFLAEVFSTTQSIYIAHERLLEALMGRQRSEWPFMTSATDLLLATFLDYIKNYPFAEARVRREALKNPGFRSFLNNRNTLELSRRRDLSVFLSRPLTRLPRLALMLETILANTPEGHPDREDIPTALQVLRRVVKSSQPGIESAESKVKLWDLGENLLFRKEEIIDLDIGEPKRTLVHGGYVSRRVRNEANLPGWQELHVFLLDNYFLITKDAGNGQYLVISRPIHLDFLRLQSADGVPERRLDCVVTQYKKRPGGHMFEPIFQPERLMFPFTFTTNGGLNGRTYTLCTATQAARQQWQDKIEEAQTLRKFDIESNRIFAVHSLFTPSEIRDPIMAAEPFTWLRRETIAVATSRSVWIGFQRDSKSYRELIRFDSGLISAVLVIPEFGWLLVVISGVLFAYNLQEMVPTAEPLTWRTKGRLEGNMMSQRTEAVSFTRVGTVKGRLLVVYAVHTKESHRTTIHFQEPLLADPHSASSDLAFRSFAKYSIEGYASEMTFFKQTVAVVTEKAFVITEPGNSVVNTIPTFSLAVAPTAKVVQMAATSKALAMFQTAESEFLLVYQLGGCFVNKFGEITRDGAFMRWNLTPSYVVYRPPHLLLFDESGGRAEVRDVRSGRVCEVVEERWMKPLRLGRMGSDLLCLTPKGLVRLKEVSGRDCGVHGGRH